MAYRDKYGVEYSDDGKTLVECPHSIIGEYVIPNGVLCIGCGAFRKCFELTKVVIPDSVKIIEDEAFYECFRMTEASIPCNVTHIGKFAFCGCESLEDLLIPDSVTSIGDRCFGNCSSLTKIILPRNLVRIEPNTFIGCASLTEITIPKTVQYIGDFAFASCCSLSAIVIPDSVSVLGECVFSDCRNLVSVELSKNMTCIGLKTFYECSNLSEISIPESVTEIGIDAFRKCESLTTIVIPKNVTSIGYGAFIKCPSLESIIVNSGNPIYDSRNFCNAIIETTTNTLISGCKNTKIPDGVSIGDGAFKGCESTTIIENLRYVETYLVEAVDKELVSYFIVDGTKWIGTSAFYECSELLSIRIPNSVVEIGNSAFLQCTNLRAITIPDSVTKIEPCAFADCSNLLNIIIPGSVTCIEEAAFSGCSNLTDIIVSNGVETIEEYAFSSCDNLQNISIPESVTNIGRCAFRDCYSLNRIVLPSSITEIGWDAFEGCTNLKEIVVPYGQKNRFIDMVGSDFADKIIEQDYEDGREMVEVKQEGIPLDIISQIESVEVVKRQGEHYAEYDYDDYLALRIKTKKGDVGFMRLYHQSKLKEGDIVDPQTLKAFTFYQEGERIMHLDGDILIGRTDLPPKYIFFDTETAGLPRNYYASYRDTDNWPRLVQIAWLLVDKDGNEIKRKSAIIYPEGFSIPQEAINVHGITTERAKREGHPLKDVLDEFMQDLVQAEKIVGHNIDFDRHIVGAELCRLNMPVNNIAYKLPVICTMRSTTNFCAIPSNNGYGGYKWPTLEELYYKVFNHEMLKAHDALADIVATKECFFELKKRGII